MEVNTYELSGGGRVTVYAPFGLEVRTAIVQQNGRYPEEGRAAVNRAREEASVVLEGSFEYRVGGAVRRLGSGDSIVVGPDVPYVITGAGRVMVMVRDEAGGKTEIVPE